MKIDSILWDNDGVLVDTERLFYLANQQLFSEFDITLTEQQFFDWFLVKNIGAWHLLEHHSAQEIAQLRARRDRIYTNLLHASAGLAMTGMQEVVEQLAAQRPMGVVTSARKEHFDLIHARLDFVRHFQFVLTDEDYSASKPSPEPYLLGAKTMRTPVENCLVVEDSPRGLQAARAAGMPCIVLRHPIMANYAFDGAYRVVDSVQELEHEVNKLL